jgi:hypothetical protein
VDDQGEMLFGSLEQDSQSKASLMYESMRSAQMHSIEEREFEEQLPSSRISPKYPDMLISQDITIPLISEQNEHQIQVEGTVQE